MSILAAERIQLNAAASDRSDAIRKAGELLVSSGCVLPLYIDGMLLRETTMSTYLGSGVAIPHGVYENRDHILQTGISVLQLPQGVEWDEGEMAYLVIGIAASSDDSSTESRRCYTSCGSHASSSCGCRRNQCANFDSLRRMDGLCFRC